MIESSYTYKTGSTLTLQVPVYDPDGTGNDAYGRQPISAIFAAMILKALDNEFPGYTIRLSGPVPIPQATVDQLTGNGLDAINVLYSDTE